MNILNNLFKLHLDIAIFLKKYIHQNNGFSSRSFYGETFSLNLLYQNGILDNESKNILLNSFEKIDKNNPEFHWEFNNYALLNYLKSSKNSEIQKYLDLLKFKNTPVTNWTLLRSVSRLIANKESELAIKEAREKIENFQLKSGLILDQKDDKSFQYHCFSMAMVAEIYEETNDEYFKNSFLKGVAFIRNFILSNGETLYIGRGQNQSFGYGALIYILSLAYKYTNDKTLLGDIKKVFNFIQQFQRLDGSFPLVLNGLEKGIPQIIDKKDEQFAGWYPYNNYFDYLPFMGYFIAKATSLLEELDTSNSEYRDQVNYEDDNFIKVVYKGYEAVLSKPGGYWTNDMPIPYIVSRNQALTPCYGGEQFQDSLYSFKGIALPYFEKFKKSIRWKGKSFFMHNVLWVISPLGIMRRKYDFSDNYIIIETRVFTIWSYKHLYLFKEDYLDICSEIDNMHFEGYEYSASGKLFCYSNKDSISKITLKVKNES